MLTEIKSAEWNEVPISAQNRRRIDQLLLTVVKKNKAAQYDNFRFTKSVFFPQKSTP